MAYFLKKSNLKKGLYLQIYESFYNPDKKQTSHKSYKPIGYLEDLIASGIEDPISFYQEEVTTLNKIASLTKQQNKEKQITSPPERYIGYFLLKNLFDGLHLSSHFDLLQSSRKFDFSVLELIEALVYSRVISPCSKNKTFYEVIPKLYTRYSLSYDQILDGIYFIGNNYEKVIEILNHQIKRKYPLHTSTTYFDCTNFYFEIDKEDAFRRKGPSKEKRTDPIVGMGLLLDANQIPIGMKMFPGNESEKPVLRTIIQDLKNRNDIEGRTIRVADKGLNCADNIVEARKNKDGYLFSKSVKMLPDKEKKWVLLEDGFTDVVDNKGKLKYRIKECIDVFPYKYTDKYGNQQIAQLKEKRVVTYNPKLAQKKEYEIQKLVVKAQSLKLSQAKKKEYGECSKYVTFHSTDKEGTVTKEKVKAIINEKKIEQDLKLAGYNMLVTSEIYMSAHDLYTTYHNLWRIEETFRVMKSYLDARPVYMQRKESIYGHFLICYLSVLLIRLLQFQIFDNRYTTEEIIKFIKTFKIIKTGAHDYINIMEGNDFVRALRDELLLPITNYYLKDKQIKMMLEHRF